MDLAMEIKVEEKEESWRPDTMAEEEEESRGADTMAEEQEESREAVTAKASSKGTPPRDWDPLNVLA